MEKYLISAILVILPTVSNAKTFSVTIPHQCAKTELMFETIAKEWKEKPIAMGRENVDTKNEKAVVSIWSNNKAKTLTVIYTSKTEGVSCIMAAAEEVEIILDK